MAHSAVNRWVRACRAPRARSGRGEPAPGHDLAERPHGPARDRVRGGVGGAVGVVGRRRDEGALDPPRGAIEVARKVRIERGGEVLGAGLELERGEAAEAVPLERVAGELPAARAGEGARESFDLRWADELLECGGHRRPRVRRGPTAGWTTDAPRGRRAEGSVALRRCVARSSRPSGRSTSRDHARCDHDGALRPESNVPESHVPAPDDSRALIPRALIPGQCCDVPLLRRPSATEPRAGCGKGWWT
jgi:hypothetical protein